MNKYMDYLKEKSSNLTVSPGVYLMKDSKENIIYVGKAKNLNNRVTSYFHNKNHLPKVELMIENVCDFDFIVTKSEYEALILECNLIKQYRPQFNILLMDDKSYSYIFIEKTAFPRLKLKKNTNSKGKYFGPFISAAFCRLLINQANDIFRLPTCNRAFTKKGKYRPCLRYHLGKCNGYCTGNISENDYDILIKQVIVFFENGFDKTIENLKNEMQNAAQNLNFEKAISIRDKLKTIDVVQSKQTVINNYYSNCDIISYVESDNEICISILIYRNGNLFDKAIYYLELKKFNYEFWDTFIAQHYVNYGNIPDSLIVSDKFNGNIDLICDFFSNYFSKSVRIISAKSGTSKELYNLSLRNATEHLTVKQNKNTKNTKIIRELYELLNLKTLPNYIESYDISNLSDSVVVAGMVVFENGIPLKKAYKHFNLPTGQGQNDFLNMYEVLKRRLSHISEEEKDIYFRRKPDLILIDGGVQHLKFVYRAMQELDIFVPMFGMVKNSKHRTRAIVDIDGNECSIRNNQSIFDFITSIQDEVHRFSVSYLHKKNKNNYKSVLLSVKGIGEKKLEKLLQQYKNLKSLKAAEKSDLMQILKVSDLTAEELLKVISEL